MGYQTDIKNASARSGDIDIAYLEVGEGFPLILLTGLGGTKELWTLDFMGPLAASFHVFALDHRGAGETPEGSRPPSIEQFAADVAGFMDALGLARAHLLGYSMGGYVAQELALAHPERVERVVLVGAECGGAGGVRQEPGVLFEFFGSSTHRPEEDTTRSFFMSSAALEENAARLEAVTVEGGGSQRLETMAFHAEAVRGWQGSCDRLPEMVKPTLVITGTEDVVVLPENARVLAELIDDSRLVEVEGAGHGVILQRPEYIAEIIKDFLAGK